MPDQPAEGRVIQMHAQYEARNPDEAEMERHYEHNRQALHHRRHGSLDAYQPRRSFPCEGVMRVVFEADNGMLTIECDQCRYVTTCRVEHEPTGAASW